MCKRFKGKIIDNNIPHLNNNRKEQSNRTSYSEVRLLECHDPTFAFLSRPSSTLWPSILMYSLFFVSNFDSAFQFSFRLSIRLFEQIVMKGFGVLVITCLILSALWSGFLYFRGIYFMGIVVHGIFVFFILTALRLEACSPDFCHPALFWLPRDLASHGSTGPSLQFCMCDFYLAVFVSIYI